LGAVAWLRRRFEAKRDVTLLRWRLTAVPVYPVLFGAAFLLDMVARTWAPLQVLPRPLLVVLAVIIAVQLGLGLVAGRHRAAFFVALLLLLLVDPISALLVALGGILFLAWPSIRERRIAPVDWPALTTVLNLAGVGVLLVGLIGGLTGGAFYLPATPVSAIGAPPANAPDIYLVLLDAYPGADVLSTEFAFDNGPFLGEMSQLGFDVADSSRSNYNLTALTLASMFNGQHINDLVPNPPEKTADQAHELIRLINEGEMLQVTRDKGYEIISLPSPIGYVTLFAADRIVGGPQMTEFEFALTEQDVVRRIAPEARQGFFLEQHRQRIRWTFDALQQLPTETSAQPRLVFAHLLLPHVPIAFGASGESVMVDGCAWTACPAGQTLSEHLREAYVAQVTYTNELVTTTAQAIIDRSQRPPVIVFFSDHGTRLTPSEPDLVFHNLTVSYTPGQPGLLPSNATPVTLLPRLFNAYLGTDVPLAPDISYVVAPSIGGLFPLEALPG
jgi:hypothetical protein